MGEWGLVMTGREQWIKASAAWISTALALVGCGQDAPPYNELPLRDALRAAPEVVASLSFETRRDLAQRLDAAGIDEEGPGTFDLPEAVTIESLARVADEAREDQGQDALIVGEVLEQSTDFVLQSEDIDAEALGRVSVGPIALRGRPGAQTAALEDIALQGRAGKWLRELSGRTNTTRMVRTTGVPFGAWAHDDTLYVNASWLVAMSALDQDGNVLAPAPGNDSTTALQGPGKNPLTIEYNPYNLPGTIAECAQQVTSTCQCGTSCNQEVTDPSFSSAVEECAWVNQDPSHPAALCVLALMSIDDVRICMQNAGAQCGVTSISTRDDAVAFVQSAGCMDSLDMCLRDGYITPSSGGSSGSGCNNNSGSGDSCSSCNKGCSDCNSNWSDCNNNCSNTNSNCGNSGNNCSNSGGGCSNSGGGGGCGKCSVKPDQGQSPIPEPVGSTFWLFAPIAYVLLRHRRRS